MSADGIPAYVDSRRTLTREEARNAGAAAARYNCSHDQWERTDPYDALDAYVAEHNVAGMGHHSELGDVFCDEYDAEYEDRRKQGWDK